MRVRMKADISGTRDGADWPRRGVEVDLPDDEGAAMCAAGLAEPVDTRGADVETTVADTSDVHTRDDRPAPKRRGRPPGSKNKPPADTPATEPADTNGEPDGD